MGGNELRNPNFELTGDDGHSVLVIPTDGDPYWRLRGENVNPREWFTYMLHGMPVEHDPDNRIGWSEVESAPIRAEPPYLYPPRVQAGNGATKMFTYSRIHDAGFGQSIPVRPGERMEASFMAHAWSSQDDDAYTSEGFGRGASYILEGDTNDDTLRNATFKVGIKFHRDVQYHDGVPLLDTNPFEGDVVWGRGAHIYNVYDHVPTLVFTVPDGVEWITYYTRSRYLWAFKHCDAYVDTCSLEYTGTVEPPPDDNLILVKQGSKTCTHSIWPDGVPDLCRVLAENGASMPVVKIVDDLGYLREIKGIDPDILTLFRFTSGDEGLTCVVNDPNYPLRDAAEMLMEPIFHALDRYPEEANLVDRWEVCNEPGGGGVPTDAYVRIAGVMDLCIVMAETRGIKIAIFSFNAGTPEWADMVAICEMGIFSRAVAGGHWLTLHEGLLPMEGAPPVEEMPIDYCYGHSIPDAPPPPPGAGCLIGRYKYFQLAMEQTGQPCPNIVFSEFRYGGHIIDPVAIVNERMRWCDDLYRLDPYVLAHCGFTWGPTPGWESSDYAPLTSAMTQYQVLIKDESNAGWNGEPPAKADGSPRESYDRLYVVLDPKRLTVSQMAVILQGFWELGQFVTSGPSYDDAMVHYGLVYPDGSVNVKAIVFNWLPEEQPELEAFRDKNYPKAQIEFREWPPDSVRPIVAPLVGIHDEVGMQHMVGQDVSSCTIIPNIVKDQPVDLDYRHLHKPGLTSFVIGRLNWDWAGAGGTIPPPAQLDGHIAAVVETIRRGSQKGVSAWQWGNEPNNRGEHPPGFTLTPEYVTEAYNRIYAEVGDTVLLSPPPIDPYFGPSSDNRIWRDVMWNGIAGAGLFVVHAGKTQTNNLEDIWSLEKFKDEPLTWQYLHAATLYTEMAQVPDRFLDLPVVLGEANPQHKTVIGGELGWVEGNDGWVAQFMHFVRDWNDKGEQQIHGVVFYRMDFDAWALARDPVILRQIVKEARR
jgi:hypothetical protein